MQRLYLDVDGVLVIRSGDRIALAPHAEQFIDFALRHFDCHWLTPHCRGDSKPVQIYLAPFISDQVLWRLRSIRPTRYDALKTEALEGDFYWVEDSPLAGELTDLCRRNAYARWIEVNARLRSDDLLSAIEQLQVVLHRPALPQARLTFRMVPVNEPIAN